MALNICKILLVYRPCAIAVTKDLPKADNTAFDGIILVAEKTSLLTNPELQSVKTAIEEQQKVGIVIFLVLHCSLHDIFCTIAVQNILCVGIFFHRSKHNFI